MTKTFEQMLREVVPARKPGRIRDLTGQRFGRLVVIGFVGIRKNAAAWHCRCDCNADVLATGPNLYFGRMKSCGCYSKERRPFVNLKHGEMRFGRRTVEYNCWQHIKNRCYCKTNHAYEEYGGRGITVCDRWLSGESGKSGFECFLEDMGRRPSDCDSIDRYPDNDGNYEPGNCRWANSAQQGSNTRRNKYVTWRGARATISEQARRAGLDAEMVRRRIVNRGWSVEKALTTPSRSRSRQ